MKKKYQKMPTWSSQNKDQYKFCLSRILSRKDIVLELGLDSRDNILIKFSSIEELLKRVKDIADQFSLGGLFYLMSLYDQDVTIFDDPFALKNIFLKSLNSSI